MARRRGLTAFTPEEFEASPFTDAGRFDSLLMAHVAEHMTEGEVVTLVRRYRHLVRDGGRVVFITPQELGFRSEPTHVQFMNFEVLRRIGRESGLAPGTEFSFPFPRAFGPIFKYNEFVSTHRQQP